MKYLLYVIVLLSVRLNVKAQNTSDIGLDRYIQSKEYILFTDTAHIYKDIMPYYSKLSSKLSKIKMYGLKEMYISKPSDTFYNLNFGIIDLKGLQIEKSLEDKIPKPKDTIINGKTMQITHVMWAGNPSGRAHSVSINKESSDITIGRSQ